MISSIARAGQRDRTFIVERWLEAYRTSHTAGMIQMPNWFRVMRPEFEAILARPNAVAYVAHAKADRDLLLGFIAGEIEPKPPMVFFVYVKDQYRRAGIARDLFAALGVDPEADFEYACSTADSAMLRSKIPRAKWWPLRARFPEGQPKHLIRRTR